MVTMPVMKAWPKKRTSKSMRPDLREKASRIKRSMTLKKSPLKTVRPPKRTTTWTMVKVRETMSKRPMKVSPPVTLTLLVVMTRTMASNISESVTFKNRRRDLFYIKQILITMTASLCVFTCTLLSVTEFKRILLN